MFPIVSATFTFDLIFSVALTIFQRCLRVSSQGSKEINKAGTLWLLFEQCFIGYFYFFVLFRMLYHSLLRARIKIIGSMFKSLSMFMTSSLIRFCIRSSIFSMILSLSNLASIQVNRLVRISDGALIWLIWDYQGSWAQ